MSLYQPGAIAERQPTWSEANPEGRWRCYELEELLARDKINLDLFWLKDESLLDSDNLPDPDVIAAEIADDLRSALEQMEAILMDLEPGEPFTPLTPLTPAASPAARRRGTAPAPDHPPPAAGAPDGRPAAG